MVDVAHSTVRRLEAEREGQGQGDNSPSTSGNLMQAFQQFRTTPQSRGRRRRRAGVGRHSSTFTITVVTVRPDTQRLNVRKRRQDDTGTELENTRKSLEFATNLTAEEFRQKLIEEFPQIEGGFEMLRCSPACQGRLLQLLPECANCPSAIKNWGGMKRSKLYLRPLQDVDDEQHEDLPFIDLSTPTVQARLPRDTHTSPAESSSVPVDHDAPTPRASVYFRRRLSLIRNLEVVDETQTTRQGDRSTSELQTTHRLDRPVTEPQTTRQMNRPSTEPHTTHHIDRSASELEPNHRLNSSATELQMTDQLNRPATELQTTNQPDRSATELQTTNQLNRSVTEMQTIHQLERPATEPQAIHQLDRLARELQTSPQLDRSAVELQTTHQLDRSATEPHTTRRMDISATELQTTHQLDRSATELQTTHQMDRSATELQTTHQLDISVSEPQTADQLERSATEPQTTRRMHRSATEPQTTRRMDRSATEPQTTLRMDRYAIEPQTTRRMDRFATEPQTTHQMDRSATELQTTHQLDISVSELHTADQLERSATEPQTTRRMDRSATEPQTTLRMDRSATEPQTTRRTDRFATEPQTTHQMDRSATEPHTTDHIGRSATELQTSHHLNRSATEPQNTHRLYNAATVPQTTHQLDTSATEPPITHQRDISGPESEVGILKRLRLQIDFDGRKNIVNVSRDNVLSCAKRSFQRNTFKDEWCLNVRFAGEDGIDEGGPSREFMRLTMRAIRDSLIFDGPIESRSFRVDLTAEATNQYRIAGRIIAYILVHGGPGPQFFSTTTYNILIGRGNLNIGLEDIEDPILKDRVQQIANASDEESFLKAVENVDDVIEFIGGTSLINFARKEELLAAITYSLVVKRKKDIINQFTEGLSCLGLFRELQENPEIMQPLFVQPPTTLDAIQVDSLFTVQFSTRGSNRYRLELCTQVYWRDLLQDLEETNQLGEMLAFVTGFERVPPLGFDPEPMIEFLHPEDAAEMHKGLPYANTCANSLRLPILEEFDTFKEIMINSINVGTIFTNA